MLVSLSSQEQTHLVRLATDRPEQILLKGDPGVSVKVMNSLARKGMAHAAEGVLGWSISEDGRQRSALSY